MKQLSWQAWTGVVVVGVVVAVATFLGLLQFQHWRQDEANVHAMVQMLNYNVAQGKLLALPTEPPAPAPAPVPAPGPEKKP